MSYGIHLFLEARLRWKPKMKEYYKGTKNKEAHEHGGPWLNLLPFGAHFIRSPTLAA
jgi:hypothetical protein